MNKNLKLVETDARKNMNIPVYKTRRGRAEPGYRAPSKVVSIPVHFVGSERTRTDSAIKIQRVVRGFLVRKTMRKIAAVRVELERIESDVRVEVLTRELRERVRVSETIMNLLLKLDSVRVLHYSGLRECRKSLINKAISLQEMLDSMVVSDSEGVKVEENCLVKEEESNKMTTLRNGEVEKEKEEEGGFMEEESIGLETSLVEEEEEQEDGDEIESLGKEEVEEKEKEEEESVGTCLVGENCLVREEEGDCDCDCEGGRREEGDGKRELLDKIVEDNLKTMEMMAQLFHRNEMQTTLLTSLSQRVEQLERSLTCLKGRAEPGYRAPSKVVSIPVHFVGSERTRIDSATKIQRVVRGFLVRKTMRKIATVRAELGRIESEVRVEVVKRELRERVRVSETIMNLLLKLDSVRVLHYSGLRECRKSLINKAIALQEMLDQMVVADSEDLKVEENCLVKEEEGNKMTTLTNGEVEKEKEEEGGFMEEESIGLETSLVEEKEEQEDGDEIEGLGKEEVEEKEKEEEESVGTCLVGENCLVKEEEGDCGCDCEGGRREEGDGKRELLDKIVEDNVKMMEMMAQLFHRNEMQTTLLTSLSQRVEQLERALTCDKLRRKKKRNVDAKNKKNHPKNGII
ncbi:BAG family molecular chaperone regulator 5, mitochondrial, partial [Mucuna pruriens]